MPACTCRRLRSHEIAERNMSRKYSRLRRIWYVEESAEVREEEKMKQSSKNEKTVVTKRILLYSVLPHGGDSIKKNRLLKICLSSFVTVAEQLS